MATVTTPRRIAEEPTTHHARTAGVSKYGISRTFRVILDLIAVYFFMRFRARPGHFFGSIGLALTAISGLVLTWLAWVKFGLGESIGGRPLLIVGIGTLIAGVHFITTGVLSELLARIYFESGTVRSYSARQTPELAVAGFGGNAQYLFLKTLANVSLFAVCFVPALLISKKKVLDWVCLAA